MLGALDDLDARLPRPARSGRPSTTRTCTPRWSAACWSGSAPLGGKLRAGRSRNDQVATDLRLYLRDHVRLIVSRLVELETALLDQAERHVDTAAPGHDPPAARPAGAVRAPAAGPRAAARARRGPAARLGQAGGGLPARRRRAGRLVAAARPGGGGRASWASTRAAANSMDAVTDRDFAAEFLLRGGADRRAPVPARRGDRAVDLAGVRLGRARRRATPPARRSCRRRRTRTSPSWPAARPAG